MDWETINEIYRTVYALGKRVETLEQRLFEAEEKLKEQAPVEHAEEV